jgi:hypothetical protein
LALTAVALSLIAASPAHAVLGGARSSVDADRAHFAATLRTTTTATHAVQMITLANGGVIREFTGPDGAVFAVTWRGPARPDLRQLLGARFSALQSDNVLPGGRRTRRPLTVRRTDFVLSGMGHPGGFHGFAYLPQQAPTGFSPKNLW